MHKVTLARGIKIGGSTVNEGVPYLMSNVLTGELLKSDKMVDGAPFYTKVQARWVDSRPPHGRYAQTIWLLRTGGFGDMLMMTPGIRALLEYGNRVNVVCDRKYQCIFDEWKHERLRVWDDPLEADLVKAEDAIVCFEGIIEGSEKARTVHAVDLFAEWMGAKPDSRKLEYKARNGEYRQAFLTVPSRPKRVGIQVKASSQVRTYPEVLLSRVIELLKEKGCDVILFGAKGEVDCDIPGVQNLSESGLTFRESCAVVGQCDAFLAPDSSLAHIAQALRIPCVLLFGSFPASLRVTGDPSITTVLEAKSECGPCFHHCGSNPKSKWPESGPCNLAGFCTTLGGIAPEKIVSAIVNLLGRGLTAPKGHDRGLQEPDNGRADCGEGEPAEAV
jgi:ADP-heptose:LPS heptosyltransferase